MQTSSVLSSRPDLKAPDGSDVDTSKDWQSDPEDACKKPGSLDDLGAERRARLKLDLTLLPVMSMIYFLSFLDRANIGNARVAGLQTALRLTDRQYQICITILFVPYICGELPANLVLRKIGPDRFMPAILTAWGLVATFQGFVSSFEGLLVVRFLLGLLEGPMLPGIILYLSGGFYTRRDLSLRLSCFFSATALSGAFSGLLAAAISKMDGLGGKGGWAWIFILEGLFTVAVGIGSFWLVPRTLQEAFWLTQAEKDALKRRFKHDRPAIGADDKLTAKEVFRSFASPHVVLMFVVSFLGGPAIYGLAFFLPSIVGQLGFPPLHTQLLSVGPFAGGFVVSLVTAWYSDKYNKRGIPLLVMTCVSIAGYATFLGSESKYARYGALHIIVAGIYPKTPVAGAWIANNSEPHYRRATSIAITVAASNVGGILSTWSFPTSEGPKFTRTTIMLLAFSCAHAILVLLNMAYLNLQNERKKRFRDEILAPYATEQEPDGGPQAWGQLGDRHPDFKYTL